jgi:Spy/CpxP family protein refolding chaperone
MKSMFKTGVVAAIAAAFVASVAVAGGQEQQQRRGGGPGFGQGRPGPGGPGRGMFQDLSEEQRAKIEAIHDAQRGAQDGPPADAKLRQQLELELLADAPNDVTLENLKQQIAAAQIEQLARHITVQKQINQVLTAEQRAKARERIAQAPQGPRGPGRRGGGFRPRH